MILIYINCALKVFRNYELNYLLEDLEYSSSARNFTLVYFEKLYTFTEYTYHYKSIKGK